MIAYYSGCGGIEIDSIEYGIEDYVVCRSGCWNGKESRHRVKVYYGDRPYFLIHGYRIHLDECLRA